LLTSKKTKYNYIEKENNHGSPIRFLISAIVKVRQNSAEQFRNLDNCYHRVWLVSFFFYSRRDASQLEICFWYTVYCPGPVQVTEGCRIRSRDCCVGSLDLLASAVPTKPTEFHFKAQVLDGVLQILWLVIHYQRLKRMKRIFKKIFPRPRCFKAITQLFALGWKEPLLPTPCTALRERGRGALSLHPRKFA
jgi:hypothetical protein